jgi:hypothetical protein
MPTMMSPRPTEQVLPWDDEMDVDAQESVAEGAGSDDGSCTSDDDDDVDPVRVAPALTRKGLQRMLAGKTPGRKPPTRANLTAYSARP